MTTPSPEARPAHVGWRLLALTYDLFAVFALSIAFGAVLTLVAWALGHPDLSDLPWMGPLIALGLWAVIGAYFVVSWARGGQTLGMRPWRLRVVGADGRPASIRALVQRYAFATAPAVIAIEIAGLVSWPDARVPFSIAAGVALAGFAWAFVDRERVPLHDRLSATRFVRLVSAV